MYLQRIVVEMRYGKLSIRWEKSGLLNLAEEKILFLQELKDVESDERVKWRHFKEIRIKNCRGGRASWYFERLINVSRI